MLFLQNLNDSQREAVKYIDGPSLVIAGAGAGKTRVLTYKIAYLLESGLKPWNILALTFTNKAAREMKSRIGDIVGEDKSKSLNMGTFHSVFSKILRVEAEKIGYKSNFTIYDESDSRSLCKSIIKEMKLDDNIYKPSKVCNIISKSKNHLILPSDFENNKEDDNLMPRLSDIYSAYQQRCVASNVMDFDDLLVNTYILLRDFPDVKKKYQEHFHFILVDEYQDTNFVQQAIILQLTNEKQNICVVGDDAQSIYGFRGANIDNILYFQEKFHNSKLFKLERNYRSTQYIVKAANSLISHNIHQIYKDVYSENGDGEKIILRKAYSDREEASIVSNEIKKIRKKEKCDYSDFAILYRTNSQSRIIEEELRKNDMPYRIYGGMSFYQRKEIKDIISYFRLIDNSDDEEAFMRIINYPTRGIGNITVNKIVGLAHNFGISLWSLINNLNEYPININKSTYEKLNSFCALINSFKEKALDTDIYELGKLVIKQSGIYNDMLNDTDADSKMRQENIEEFLGGLKDFVDTNIEEGNEKEIYLTDFLQLVSLLSDSDKKENPNAPCISLMTIHSAKGLEFPTVFIVGVEENIFPSPMSCQSKRELEEERRLLYVAITRAEKHCYISYAINRFRFGKMEVDAPSRFISDIDSKYVKTSTNTDSLFETEKSFVPNYRNSNFSTLDEIKKEIAQDELNQKHSSKPAEISTNSISSNPKIDEQLLQLKNGCIIEHQRFGKGKIICLEGTGENTKATVLFDNCGTKQLLLKFAKYRIIE